MGGFIRWLATHRSRARTWLTSRDYAGPAHRKTGCRVFAQAHDRESMPIEISPQLRFAPDGSAPSLDAEAMWALLALARKVQHPSGAKSTIETFKEHLCRCSGERYAPSSSLDWAESDLQCAAAAAAENAATFVAAFCDACEEPEGERATVPGEGSEPPRTRPSAPTPTGLQNAR